MDARDRAACFEAERQSGEAARRVAADPPAQLWQYGRWGLGGALRTRKKQQVLTRPSPPRRKSSQLR
ncbi:hypothetical protein NDU88_001813 [Pleurodeles waltl]|uniref:Uncharacterized protein n=1 Tax=Pleurodeles waltl TaxID=8319 RepID=A0AAV7TJV4_PLEWA|nr:hypothetical protein NDU88_001813 [Pleurodeles waltl]